MIKLKTPSGTQLSFNTFCMMFMVAIAESGVFELGFQITTSPAMAASIEFHAQTATGKLNDVINPTIPIG